MRASTILIAEDERTARTSLAGLLEAEGFRVLTAENGTEALSVLLSEEPEAAVLDIRMPGMDGLAVLRRAKEGGSDSALIVMTAHGDSGTAIEAMKLGAFDYVSKPLDFKVLLTQIERAIGQRKLARQLRAAQESAPAPPISNTMVGHSPAMQHVYKLIGQVSTSNATVLVRGESGTGKELVVNAIHHNSARAQGPLIKVNCASIPEALLESELFGHEKGAFTNALYRRIGRFEEANGGTLFLDEIGELAPALQSKLLRALQERVIERLGSNTPIPVDIRLVAATSRDLEAAVNAGSFREDLYYRLNVVAIALPPLRERRQDIPALVQHFINRSEHAVSITSSALTVLCDYHWPGNVRELENVVERALVLARSGVITEDEIQLKTRPEQGDTVWTDFAPLEEGMKANVATLEKALIERALRQTQGNKTRAAEILGVHRRLLYEKIREHGLPE
ncbi:MAG TPA: sigma-54 dependent transcriptional regulator [Bryobacteraceae bacterium]|jgi:two-component system response regulator AtoC|nr:sigma-54 dependent transcriptional regulator [Bryobacteraceae bacterium]